MADVPLDILINHIFIRLPVRSLLRCRCVCKQWLGLLTDPMFITMHFKHQKIHSHRDILLGPLLLVYNNKIKSGNKIKYGGVGEDYRAKLIHRVFYAVDLDSSSSAAAADVVRLPGFHLEDYSLLRFLGYCNGMVCMKVLRRDFKEEDYWKSKHLLFGNPSTGDYRILPEPIVGPLLLVGFGYDSSVDDYKFVRVDNIIRNSRIFSLKSNSWRTLLGSSNNYLIRPAEMHGINNVGFALDGSIYWLVERSNMIVGFDLKDEEFRELPLPSDRPRDMGQNILSLKVVEGSLCIINISLNKEITVWSMLKEEGNNNKEKYCCWIKSMKVTLSARKFWGFSELYPLSFMKDGKVLCCVVQVITMKLKDVLIDPKTKRLQDFTLHGISSDWLKDHTFWTQQTAYIDTLVSPRSYDYR